MKQAAAIFLMGIFSFNIFGYQFFYDQLLHKADQTLEVNLEQERYEEAQLISIKEPINFPYYTNSKIFQSENGEVIKNGVIYRFVKSRIYNDSLEMLCIPHIAKMKIQNAKEAFFKLANDLEQSNEPNNNHSSQKDVKRNLSDFEELAQATSRQPMLLSFRRCVFYVPGLPDCTFIKAERPPNV